MHFIVTCLTLLLNPIFPLNLLFLPPFLSLPKVVKRRIKALKNYQVKYTQMEAKFYEEVHQLECKYAKMYEGLFEKVQYMRCLQVSEIVEKIQ